MRFILLLALAITINNAESCDLKDVDSLPPCKCHGSNALRILNDEELKMSSFNTTDSIKILNLKLLGYISGYLNKIKNLPLKYLDVSDTNDFTDSCLDIVSKLTSLENFNASLTKVSDENIGSISSLQNLKRLNLAKTQVTSGSLSFVMELKDLEELNLDYLILSKDFLDKLLMAKSGIKISTDNAIIF